MAALLIPNARQPRRFRRVDLQTDQLDDAELRRRYRFGSANLDMLERLLRHGLTRPTNRNHPLTEKEQILLTLRFYASGSFLQAIGDTFGVDEGTVSRTVDRVTNLLFRLKDNVIVFPTTDEDRQTVRRGFYKMRGFPGVIGCLDGTHIRIQSPPLAVERAYVNRKCFHSINVMACCDHVGRFTSINSSWPGSAHDSHVFRMSNLCQYLEANHYDLDKGVLLGDSGYPCRPFLLTPYPNPTTQRQERYNASQTSTRNTIERAFGVWKRKFHILHSELRLEARKVSRVIVACAVLHNLSIKWREPQDDDDNDGDGNQPPNQPYQELMMAELSGSTSRTLTLDRSVSLTDSALVRL